MSARPYQLGKRQDQIDQSRQRIVDAARSLLAEATTYTDFTMDSVARRADVARATVYYQFESKTGLLEALCDDLAEEAQMSGLAEAFAAPDPIEALRLFIASFGRFSAIARPVMRRLRALAALDPEVEAVIAARDARRRTGSVVLLGKRPNDAVARPERDPSRCNTYYTMHDYETFDTLAGPDQELTAVVGDVIYIAERLLA